MNISKQVYSQKEAESNNQELENLRIMFDNEGHWIDDPLDVVNAKPDFSGLGMEPKHKQKKEL